MLNLYPFDWHILIDFYLFSISLSLHGFYNLRNPLQKHCTGKIPTPNRNYVDKIRTCPLSQSYLYFAALQSDIMNLLVLICGCTRVYLKRESTPTADYAELIIVGVSRPKRWRCMHSLCRRANLHACFVMGNYVRIICCALGGASFPSYKIDNLE